MQKATKYLVVGVLCCTILLSGGLAMVNGKNSRDTKAKTEKMEKVLVPVTFRHVGGGIYQRDPVSGTNCAPVLGNPCTITYLDEDDVTGITSFNQSEQPEGETTNTDDGVWM